MALQASSGHLTKEIYGATSRQVGGWQHLKSPMLVAVQPVLLDGLTDSSSSSNNRQFTAGTEKQSSLNNGSQRAPFSGAKADGLPGSAAQPGDGWDSKNLESIFNVYNSHSNYDSNANSDSSSIDFAKYDKTKLLELSIIDVVEQSALAAEQGRPEVALTKAKEALNSLDLLKNLIAQDSKAHQGNNRTASLGQPVTTEARLFELSLMINSNLAEQLLNNHRLEESIDVYTQLCKLANSSGNSGFSSASQHYDSRFLLHRFGLNIGNILNQMGDYQRALKYYRLTLDRMSSTGYKNLKIKLMNNISMTLVILAEQTNNQPATKDGLISMNVLLADNLLQQTNESVQKDSKMTAMCNGNHHRFGLNLLTCQYLLGDSKSMMETLKSLVRVDICHHYRRILDISTMIGGNTAGLRHDKGGIMQKQSNQHWRNLSRTSSHATVSTGGRTISRLARHISVNQAENNELHDGKQRTASALGAPSNRLDTHPNGSGLIDHGRTEIVQDQDDHHRTLSTTLSKFGHNRLDFQHTTEGLRGMSGSSITSKTAIDKEEITMQVLAGIECDRLEMMSNKQHNLTVRSLMIGCNLLIDLNRKSSHHAKQISAFDFCSQLLSTSEMYKHLVDDLRMNNAIEMLLSGDSDRTRSALDIFKDIESRILSHHRESTNQNLSKARRSFLLELNLSLLNLIRNDYEKASKNAENATKMDQYNSNVLTNLANCHYFRNDLRAAQAIYKRALSFEPSSWPASYNLAVVTRKLGLGLHDLDELARQQLKSKSDEYASNIQTGRKRLALPAVQSALA